MQDWRAKLGRNARRLWQQRDLTQEQLAFDAEIDLTYVGGIERGKRNPSLLVMARIADALSVTLTKLLAKRLNPRPARRLAQPGCPLCGVH
jgi:transcriptional regulator with XRE-family HTH domain